MADDAPTNGMDRRRFLKVAGAGSAGTVALAGCGPDTGNKLVTYIEQDEHQVPGLPTMYASTCTECAAGCGLHVTTREGRAINLAGNPDHPINAGALCARGTAALQGLYNPDRLRGPMQRTEAGGFAPIGWDEALALVQERLAAAGGRVAVISGAGPGTLNDLLGSWMDAVGGRLVRYQPFDHEPMRMANEAVFGRADLPHHDFAAARHILSLGGDFLETWVSPVEYQRGFAASHGFAGGQMARHVAFAPRLGLTELNADEAHVIHPGSEAAVALAIANHVLAHGTHVPADAAALRGALAGHTFATAAEASGVPADVLERVAAEFAAASPSLAVAGGIAAQHQQAVGVAAAVNILNYVAGNVGTTVRFGAEVATADGYAALDGLGRDLDAGRVAVAIVHAANPAYATPAAAGFAARFAKAGFRVSTASVLDETAALCDLLLPASHALESWDDVRPRDGVDGLMQPVMEPVFDTRDAGSIMLALAKAVPGSNPAPVAATWRDHLRSAWGGEASFRTALARGGSWTAETPAHAVSLAPGAAAALGSGAAATGDGDFTLVAFPTSMYHDGRGANRPWLLENPDPVTKITWQTWVELHPDTARALDVREGEVLRLETASGSIEAPAWLHAGVARDVVAVPLGLGHTEYGRYAQGRGANPLALVPALDGLGFVAYGGTKVRVAKAHRYQKLAKTEGNPRQLGRGIVEAMPLEYAAAGMSVAEAHRAHGGGHHEVNTAREREAIAGWGAAQKERSFLGDYQEGQPQWGLAVDLARCTGCSACVTACYAENNIPTVGEAEVLRGREMSWLRVERYWEGGSEGEPLEARFLPLMCQHCDNAPCEPVCPVYAAYHTPDGLNGQVYNRCVGTRYCSNNCPYKVRYFNWLAYNKLAFPEPLPMQLNPEVTVRARGVMEKCTFCVQRIRGAQHEARLAGRAVADGDIVTACAQACPSGAITFGDRTDAGSRLRRVADDARGYHVLEEINVRPAVTYLAKVRHVPTGDHGPEPAAAGSHEGGH